MIDAILAAIQQVEPTAIPLVAIMLSSVAMYAIGILLPCGKCCVCRCDQCEQGDLPDTLTVTFSGFPTSATNCCGNFYNGLAVVVKRRQDFCCRYFHNLCGVGNIRFGYGSIEVAYNGPNQPATITITSEIPPDGGSASVLCNASLQADVNIVNCETWRGENGEVPVFRNQTTATATVAVGGEYVGDFLNPGGSSCFICCKGDEPMPPEVAVQLEDTRVPDAPPPYLPGFPVPPVTPFRDFSGTYVLQKFTRSYEEVEGNAWVTRYVVGWGATFLIGASECRILVSLKPCSSQTSTAFNDEQAIAFEGEYCNECHKKCRWTAWVRLTESGNSFYEGYDWFQRERSCYVNNRRRYLQCPLCEATPICSPSGKSFSLCSNGKNQDINPLAVDPWFNCTDTTKVDGKCGQVRLTF